MRPHVLGADVMGNALAETWMRRPIVPIPGRRAMRWSSDPSRSSRRDATSTDARWPPTPTPRAKAQRATQAAERRSAPATAERGAGARRGANSSALAVFAGFAVPRSDRERSLAVHFATLALSRTVVAVWRLRSFRSRRQTIAALSRRGWTVQLGRLRFAVVTEVVLRAPLRRGLR